MSPKKALDRATLALFVAVMSTFICAPQIATAASKRPKPAAVIKEVLEVDKAMDKLERLFARLSDADKAKVIERLSSRRGLADSDNDDVPDVIDDGAGRCDNDEDDDGKKDGDELLDEDDPADSDSDNDGRPDGMDPRVHGKVDARDGNVFSIQSIEFELNDETKFEDDLTADDIIAGACLAVKGRQAVWDGLAVAQKIAEEDGCD